MNRILNTASSAALGITGIVAGIVAPLPWGALFGVSMVLLGLGSAAFHWSRDRDMQALDEIGMYTVAITLAAMWLSLPWWMAALAWLVAAWGALEYFDSFKVIPFMVAGILGAMLFQREWWALACGVLFGLAWFFRQHRDEEDPGHGPAHWVWHILVNLAAALAFALWYF